MIARLLRLLVAAEVATAIGVGFWLSGPVGWPAWAAIAGALAVAPLAHGWVIGLQSLTGAWQRSESARLAPQQAPGGPGDIAARPAPGLRSALAAWLGESLASVRSFVLWMPWLGNSLLPSGSDGRRVPVMLVHGFLCNRAVWRPMAAWLAARGHAVESINLEPPFAGIDDYVPGIEQAVERLRARTGAERVALIGHSMGGIAIRAWLRRHGAARVAAVVTLGSPHRGTWSARHAIGRNVAQMRPESPWLADLARSETPALRRLFTVILSLHDNIVMPQATQTLDDARIVVLEGLGHVQLAQHRAVRPPVAEALERAERETGETGETSDISATPSQ